jgi:hypothetical protein
VVPAEQLQFSNELYDEQTELVSATAAASHVPQAPAAAAAHSPEVVSEVELHDWEAAGDDYSALLRRTQQQS